jgi:von Willebrand factor A domain-containing protein 7
MLSRTLPAIALVLCASHPVSAQPQQPRYSFGWPCSGRVDPSYVRSAEATGGKVMLFKPTEVSGMADEMSASRGHGETVVRAGGQLDEGLHEFDVPLDSTIESAYFFVSLQCLQSVAVLQPSGDLLQVDAPEVTYRAFDAIRLITIKAPSPGTWKVRMAGRGFFSLIVNAQTDLALASVSLVQNGVPINGLAPLGQSVQLQAAARGEPGQVDFQFISMSGARLATVELGLEQEASMRRTYAAQVMLPTTEFRLAMTGVDAKGFSFQRVTPRLFVADR